MNKDCRRALPGEIRVPRVLSYPSGLINFLPPPVWRALTEIRLVTELALITLPHAVGLDSGLLSLDKLAGSLWIGSCFKLPKV